MNSEETLILSDDEDLPDLFGGNNDATEEKFEIAQHDIVWAEFRNLYWPALVRCVKKKERKASVWYLDSPRKCFKVPFKKIKSFSDPEMTALIKNEVENSPMKAKHKRVWLDAITYIRRKTQGYTDDPAIFFDLNKHYLAYEDNKFDKHISGDTENSDTTLTVGDIKENVKFKNSDAECSDEESLLSDDGEEKIINEKLSVFTNLDESYEDDPEVDNIVKCIAAGYVDKHLQQVKSKKVHSSYLELYEDALKSNKGKLIYITPTNHVKSMKKLKEIATYLMNYYEQAVEGGKCEMVNYVLYVWVPEAIDKAVELISAGSLNLNRAIPETRRKLFPTDKLVNMQTYDFAAPFQNDSVTNIKKRAGSRSQKKKQPKKVKISDVGNKFLAGSSSEKETKSLVKSPSKEKNEPTIKSPRKRSKPSVQSSKTPVKFKKNESQLPIRSSPRKETKSLVKSLSEEKNEPAIKSPKKGSKPPVQSSKKSVKSKKNESKLSIRSSPRKKV